MNNKIILLVSVLLIAGCAASKFRQSASGLQYRIIKKGSGPKAKTGQEILLLETTSYREGTVLFLMKKRATL